MAAHQISRDTTCVDALIWNDGSFGDATADSMWARLPDTLKQIALAELDAGNTPIQILLNEARGIVLLELSKPPMTARPDAELVRIHTSFASGNYCYDGTLCTYEDLRTGSFLAFDDPDYEDPF